MELYYYTDYACPFCYIAQRHVAAFAEATGAQLIPRYVEIHPEVPPQGCDRRLLLEDAQNERLTAFLSTLGAPYGLTPSLGARLSSSEKALTVRAWVSIHAPEQLAALDAAVYPAYCEAHLDIGRDEVLQSLLSGIGLTEPVSVMLRDTRAKSIYENDRFRARQERIRAVPSFHIGAELMAGLQTPEGLQEAYFRQLAPRHP